jgi:hypothetical protein
MDAFELTFYVNPNPDIKELKPYAAYNVVEESWTVPPTVMNPPVNPQWDQAVQQDEAMASQIIERYTTALNGVRTAPGAAHRITQEAALRHAVEQGGALFDAIHESRGAAFSGSGEGFADFHNYRWQAGKQSGVIQALKKLKDASKNANEIFATETYGVELPDVSTLIRRATRS